MENLPAGAASKLRELEEDCEDETPVNHSIPDTWGATNNSGTWQTETSRTGSSSGANSFATHEPDRSYAPAFITKDQRQDPYQPYGQTRSFAFSTAVPMAPRPATWNTMDPPPARGGSSSRPQAGGSTPRFLAHQESGRSASDVNAARNQALEGVFNSESVIRVTDTRYRDVPSQMRSTTSDGASQQSLYDEQDFDGRLENPRLNIDPNVRVNFVPLSQLHSAPVKRSAFEMQNPTLIASNKDTRISTIIGGETVTYTPNPMDERVRSLDRHGNYIGKNQGEISKRLKHQHIEKATTRDTEMVEATKAYQALLAMTPEARTELLERLRKPFVFYGAFDADQQELDEIPEIYTRAASSIRVMNWMDSNSPGAQNIPGTTKALASSTVSSSHAESADGFQTFDDFGDLDDFAAGSSFVPLESRVQRLVERTQKYFEDAVFFGKKTSKDQVSQGPNSVRPPLPSQSSDFNSRNLPSPRSQSFTTPRNYQSSDLSARAPSSHRSGSTARAQYRFPQTTPGRSELGQSPKASSRGIDDPFTFDDSPEFQIPQDVNIDSTVDLTAQQDRLYQLATSKSQKYGRVVLIRLHEPVKFTPGAIAQRVFGGIVQEMQLFPTQRLAIVVFLHCTEAKAFIRHVKRTHEIGSAYEIRYLQIEAGWYK
jgi:hypothetical protein